MNPQQDTPDPMTAMSEGMAALHEIFLSAVAAGFTEQQAMSIVIKVALEALKGDER